MVTFGAGKRPESCIPVERIISLWPRCKKVRIGSIDKEGRKILKSHGSQVRRLVLTNQTVFPKMD